MNPPRRITIIDGHPDPARERFVHALAGAYAEGAAAGGHETRRLNVAELELPVLRSRAEWEAPPPPAVAAVQETIAWANHIIVIYPLWLGDVPALLKAFLEQVARPGFAVAYQGSTPAGLLAGRSARLIVTMGMPAFFYRLFYGAHSVKSLERNVLKLTGIKPVEHSLIGNVEGSAEDREEWLSRVRDLGLQGR
jgi:putative NADPH-quinone reductase